MDIKAILSAWKDCWGSSSLFECFDNCERDVAKWWLKIMKNVEEQAFSQGYKEGLLKAVEVVSRIGADRRWDDMNWDLIPNTIASELEALKQLEPTAHNKGE